jgi:hypothetical protein
MAEALRDWLPDVIQACEPWISSEDIDPGARWSSDLAKQLEQVQFGIICLTPKNLTATWIHFEAGAVSKKLDDNTRLCPYLLGLKPTDMEGPLVQFQAVKADKNDTRKLVHTLNHALGSEALSNERIDRAFDIHWPHLEETLKEILASAPETKESERHDEDKLDEILKIVREQSRLLSGIQPHHMSPEDEKREAIIAAIQSPELMNLILRQSDGEQVDPIQFLNALAAKPDIARAILKAVPLETKSSSKGKRKLDKKSSQQDAL